MLLRRLVLSVALLCLAVTALGEDVEAAARVKKIGRRRVLRRRNIRNRIKPAEVEDRLVRDFRSIGAPVAVGKALENAGPTIQVATLAGVTRLNTIADLVADADSASASVDSAGDDGSSLEFREDQSVDFDSSGSDERGRGNGGNPGIDTQGTSVEDDSFDDSSNSFENNIRNGNIDQNQSIGDGSDSFENGSIGDGSDSADEQFAQFRAADNLQQFDSDERQIEEFDDYDEPVQELIPLAKFYQPPPQQEYSTPPIYLRHGSPNPRVLSNTYGAPQQQPQCEPVTRYSIVTHQILVPGTTEIIRTAYVPTTQYSVVTETKFVADSTVNVITVTNQPVPEFFTSTQIVRNPIYIDKISYETITDFVTATQVSTITNTETRVSTELDTVTVLTHLTRTLFQTQTDYRTKRLTTTLLSLATRTKVEQQTVTATRQVPVLRTVTVQQYLPAPQPSPTYNVGLFRPVAAQYGAPPYVAPQQVAPQYAAPKAAKRYPFYTTVVSTKVVPQVVTQTIRAPCQMFRDDSDEIDF